MSRLMVEAPPSLFFVEVDSLSGLLLQIDFLVVSLLIQ